MGKIYIDTVKYVIHANVEIVGLVEKPDVVGAIFGQTEGLLGEELDLRELQKNGRIGRIEVNLQPKGNRSVGNIEVPSSLDVVETCIIGSALETVDRVGPCEANIIVQRVEDTRNIKRKKVVDRAKELVKKMLTSEIPERKELSEIVRAEVKTAEISSYGPDKLPAGPNIDSAEAIILVEGRADVINLLKNDINNVVALGGANVPKSVIDLCRRKEVTLFVDGDRGGDIILREITNAAEVDYVARAPLGMEVEELARKEILKALRARMPIEQSEATKKRREEMHAETQAEGRVAALERGAERAERFAERGSFGRGERPPSDRGERSDRGQGRGSFNRGPERSFDRGPERPSFDRGERPPQDRGMERQAIVRDIENMIEAAPERKEPPKPAAAAMPPEMQGELNTLEGSLKARFYDADMKMLKEVAVRDVTRSLEETPDVNAVVLDGIITQRLVDLTESKAVKMLAGIKMGNVFRKPDKLQIFVKQS
ncbi:DNA primase DnaG [uncultured archaeon]|nr:DNA primase DnaG [uncultured archaeon]